MKVWTLKSVIQIMCSEKKTGMPAQVTKQGNGKRTMLAPAEGKYMDLHNGIATPKVCRNLACICI